MIWVWNSALLIRGKYLPDTWDLLEEIQYLHKTSKKVFFHRFYLECYIKILIKIILIETHEILWFLKNTFRICTLNKDIENLRVATVKSVSLLKNLFGLFIKIWSMQLGFLGLVFRIYGDKFVLEKFQTICYLLEH